MFLPLRLQLFAEDPITNKEDPHIEDNQSKEKNPEPDVKYTDEDVNKLINKKFAEWQQKQDEEVKRAERRAKMSEKERLDEEKSELQKQLDAYKQKELVTTNAQKIGKQLAEANLPHDEDLIGLLASSDEAQSEDAFNIVKAYVSRIIKQQTSQHTPPEGQSFNGESKKQENISELAKKNRIIK